MKYLIKTSQGPLEIDATCEEAAILDAQNDGYTVLDISPAEVPRAA